MAVSKYSNANIAKYVSTNRPEYKYISGDVSDGTLSRIVVKHIPCGNNHTVIVKGFFAPEIKGYCKICKPIQVHLRVGKLTEKDIKQRLKNIFPDGEYKYISGFLNSKSKMIFKHTSCNTQFSVSSHMFFGVKKSRCPNCAHTSRSVAQTKLQSVDNYLQTLLKDAGLCDDYVWLEGYTGNNKYRHLILHKKCGERALIRPNDVQQGYVPCPCEGSKYEVRFKKLLDKAGLIYEREYKVGKSFRVDFMLRDIHNHMYFFEIDGEFHKDLVYRPALDARKDEHLLALPNVSVYRINYDENFEEIVTEIKDLVIQE